MRVVVTSNHYGGVITTIDISDADEAYYLVISDEPFESEWVEFKKYCMENFVTPHIVFITPLSKIVGTTYTIEEFLTSYIYMSVKDAEVVGYYD
jgi:uncharacterized protein YPO0396